MSGLPYDYEHICIDNCSSDSTVNKIKAKAAEDKCIKLIASELQDPSEMIAEFIKKWEQGYKTMLAVKPESEESAIMFVLRKAYYRLIARISEVPLVQNATGAGLFDRAVEDILRSIQDLYPYFMGLLCEIGFPIATIPFKQPEGSRE